MEQHVKDSYVPPAYSGKAFPAGPKDVEAESDDYGSLEEQQSVDTMLKRTPEKDVHRSKVQKQLVDGVLAEAKEKEMAKREAGTIRDEEKIASADSAKAPTQSQARAQVPQSSSRQSVTQAVTQSSQAPRGTLINDLDTAIALQQNSQCGQAADAFFELLNGNYSSTVPAISITSVDPNFGDGRTVQHVLTEQEYIDRMRVDIMGDYAYALYCIKLFYFCHHARLRLRYSLYN